MTPEKNNIRRRKLGTILSDTSTDEHDHFYSPVSPTASNTFYSNSSTSTYNNNLMSPYTKSPWIHQIVPSSVPDEEHTYGLIGSLFREEGHVHSLAAAEGLLYTGSDSKNLRVWKDLKEFSGFKSKSGLVKAIVVVGDKVFTGHQDGKIRVWRYLGETENNTTHKRVGNLPTTRDLLLKSFNPRSYVEVRRRRNVPWVKHYDAVSCLTVDSGQGLLYSGSWDKTLKVWNISDSKCMESIQAHDDAVNAVVVGFNGLVFTGSADGRVKAWRRELVGRSTEHVLVETLLRQENAVTSLVVSGGGLYAGSSDGFVSFWEKEKHFMSYGGVLRGHKLAVLCMAAGGDLVMSGSADNSICVWRREGGGGHTCLAVLTGHSGPVKCMAVEKEYDDDNEWIVYSGSFDKSVKVWRVFDRLRESHVE